MKKCIIIAIILAAWNCPAAPVELPDNGGFAVEDVSTGDEPFAPWAFAETDTRDPALSADVAPDAADAAGVDVTTTARLPLAVQAGSGQETRVSVNPAAVDSEWPWYAKAAIVVGCVAVAGVATWAVVESCGGGRHDNDGSQHMNLNLSGDANQVTVHFHTDEPTTTTTGR